MELPGEPVLRELIQRTATLWARLSHEVGSRPMILPNATFFPDPYHHDEPSVNRLVQRLAEHAGMQDVPVEVCLIAPDAEEEAASCSSGGCGPAVVSGSFQRVVDRGDGWQLNVAEAELLHPVALTTELGRGLALIFLLETHEAGAPLEGPLELTTELTAVALGMGPLLLQGSYIYAKGCGGPRISQLTQLSTFELAVITALFCTLSGVPHKTVSRELSVTQKEAFAEAVAFISSNPELTLKLKRAPELLAMGDFTLNPTRSWLSRVLAPAKVTEEAFPLWLGEKSTAELPPARSPKSARHAELKALVSDALSEGADHS
ncbi:MAG: hypothetical protein SFV15_16235 [Polyangiaceae bacterium]|nr:hypothetical protein [Polyangiaceae bacterium]